MKLGLVTKLKEKYGNVKKDYDDFMLANCDVIVFFPIYGKFAAFQKPDSGCIVYNTYVFINNNLLSYKS